MPDFWELKNGLNPHDASDANDDPDHDGLINLDEYRHGTDPHNPDTDGGGVNDGDEVKLGMNPLDPSDDAAYLQSKKAGGETALPFKSNLIDPHKDLPPEDFIDPRSKLDEGIYILQPQCNACPCISSIDHTADIIPGDLLFAVISSDDNSQIFSKSNVVTVTKIPEGPVVEATATALTPGTQSP
jgi:hypothetical protein